MTPALAIALVAALAAAVGALAKRTHAVESRYVQFV